MKEFAFLQWKEFAPFRTNFFALIKSILEDFATQASEQEVINAGSFINGSKTQRCTATVPCLYTVSFNREQFHKERNCSISAHENEPMET